MSSPASSPPPRLISGELSAGKAADPTAAADGERPHRPVPGAGSGRARGHRVRALDRDRLGRAAERIRLRVGRPCWCRSSTHALGHARLGLRPPAGTPLPAPPRDHRPHPGRLRPAPGRHRWGVECTLGWLLSCKRLTLRYDTHRSGPTCGSPGLRPSPTDRLMQRLRTEEERDGGLPLARLAEPSRPGYVPSLLKPDE